MRSKRIISPIRYGAPKNKNLNRDGVFKAYEIDLAKAKAEKDKARHFAKFIFCEPLVLRPKSETTITCSVADAPGPKPKN